MNEESDEEIHTWGSERSWTQELLFPWSWDVPPLQHMDVLTNPKALWTLYLWDFYGSFFRCVPVCVHAKSLQSCQTLCNPMDCSLPISIFGILQARKLEWVAMPSSRGSSWPREHTHISSVSSALSRGYFTNVPSEKLPFMEDGTLKIVGYSKLSKNW